MTIKPIRFLAALLLLCSGSLANAASVTLVPLTVFSGIGDQFTLQVQIDFTAEGGTLGGGFDLIFDESTLQLVSFTDTVILGDPAFGRPPDYVPGSGLLESWGVGDFSGLQTGVVGEVTFEVVNFGPGQDILISLGPTMGIAGPWVSAEDFVTIIEPEYNSVSIAYIPLPAAAWLLISALGPLLVWRRTATGRQ